jgi:hypothetical protein
VRYSNSGSRLKKSQWNSRKLKLNSTPPLRDYRKWRANGNSYGSGTDRLGRLHLYVCRPCLRVMFTPVNARLRGFMLEQVCKARLIRPTWYRCSPQIFGELIKRTSNPCLHFPSELMISSLPPLFYVISLRFTPSYILYCLLILFGFISVALNSPLGSPPTVCTLDLLSSVKILLNGVIFKCPGWSEVQYTQ